MPVVGHGDAARLLQLGDVGELLAFLAARHGANRIYPRKAGLGRFLEDVFGDSRIVVHRAGVGHARNRGEAAGNSGGRPGCDRLLVLLTRLAQVDVHVDQTGTHHQTRSDLEDGDAVFDGQVSTDPRDAFALEEDIEHAVAAVHRIDDVPAFQKSFRHSRPNPLPVRRPAGRGPPS